MKMRTERKIRIASRDATFGFAASLLLIGALLLIASWGRTPEGWSICSVLG